MSLLKKQQSFVDGVLSGMEPKDAALRAGYSPGVAKGWRRLIETPEIAAALAAKGFLGIPRKEKSAATIEKEKWADLGLDKPVKVKKVRALIVPSALVTPAPAVPSNMIAEETITRTRSVSTGATYIELTAEDKKRLRAQVKLLGREECAISLLADIEAMQKEPHPDRATIARTRAMLMSITPGVAVPPAVPEVKTVDLVPAFERMNARDQAYVASKSLLADDGIASDVEKPLEENPRYRQSVLADAKAAVADGSWLEPKPTTPMDRLRDSDFKNPIAADTRTAAEKEAAAHHAPLPADSEELLFQPKTATPSDGYLGARKFGLDHIKRVEKQKRSHATLETDVFRSGQ